MPVTRMRNPECRMPNPDTHPNQGGIVNTVSKVAEGIPAYARGYPE